MPQAYLGLKNSREATRGHFGQAAKESIAIKNDKGWHLSGSATECNVLKEYPPGERDL